MGLGNIAGLSREVSRAVVMRVVVKLKIAWEGIILTMKHKSSVGYSLTLIAAGILLASPLMAGNLAGPVCQFPDISGVTPAVLEAGAGDPAGNAAPIPGGRWELAALRTRLIPPLPIPIAGEATGALVLDANSPIDGQFSAALEVDITAPAAQMRSETGAGSYSQTSGLLNFNNECGDALTLSDTVYRVDSTGPDPVWTLWGSVEVPIEQPFPLLLTIELEADFLLVEPQGAADPVFDDRFEAP